MFIIVAPSSSGLGRWVFIPEIGGPNPPGVTILEIAKVEGAALAAPPSADSAAKGKSRVAEKRRSFKKKFEPTFFAMIDKSWQLFSARATFVLAVASTMNYIRNLRK